MTLPMTRTKNDIDTSISGELMNELILRGALPLAVGLMLGLVYFGGLWMTVRHVVHSNIPGVVLLVSWLARTALVLGGLWLVSSGRLQAILAFMIGFLVARFILIARLKPSLGTPNEGHT